jgi:DnaJ-class molecular chaperone
MSNYYETLGVGKDASEQDIKRAYRALSLKWHPDRNTSPDAQSKFQEIGQAYETLSDSGKRAEYNDELDGINRNPFFRTNSMAEPDISDIFNMMFGQASGGPLFGQGGAGPLFGQGGAGPFGQGGAFGQEIHLGGQGGPKIHIFRQGFPGQGFPFFQQQLQKPPPIIKNVEITFEQAYSGCVLHVEVDKWTIQQELKINELEMVYVNIPAGVDQDEIIVLRDCGNTVSPELKGDIKFVVKIAPSSLFERYGMDLIYKKQITLKEALTGFSFELHHVSGKMLCLNNNTNRTIIKPNYKKVISNLGMLRDGNSGNLIIEFSVVFPDTLSLEQMTALSQIL